METKDGYCAVLKDDGTLEKIKMTAEVGQEIDLATVSKKARKVRKFSLRYAAMAASVAFVAVASGYVSFMQDYSFVSTDVGASVEYSLNRMDRVVRVSAFNKEGEKLADSVKKEGVEGNTLDEAVNMTADVLQRDGYIEKSDDVVLVSVSSKDKKKSGKLKDKVKKSFDESEMTASVEDVSLEERKEAKEVGLSTPRYAVVKELSGEEPLDEAAIEVANAKRADELLMMAEEVEEISLDEDSKVGVDEMEVAKAQETCDDAQENADGEIVELDDALSQDKKDTKDVESSDEELKQREDNGEEDLEAIDPEDEKVDAKDGAQEDEVVSIEDESSKEHKDEPISPTTVPVEKSVKAQESEESESTQKNLIQEVVEPIEKVFMDMTSPAQP